MMSNTYDSLHPKEDGEFSNLSLPNLSSLKSLRVLLVDDDIDSLLLTSFFLEEYVVTMTAVSADEAIKMFLESKPDLLICDLAMPGEDGYSLIRKIRKLEIDLGGEIPAIALTALVTDADRSRSIEAGFQAYLAKPIELDELVGIVAALAMRF